MLMHTVRGGQFMKGKFMKALVVVDFQNDFVNGTLGFEGAENLTGVIAEKIRKCRAEGGEVLFTMDVHGKDYLETREGKALPVPHCIEGTKGCDIYGGIADMVLESDTVIKKHTFGSLELADILSRGAFDEIELCGLVTDICVLANAVLARAAAPECHIVVDSSAVASPNKEAHQAAFTAMKSQQIEVI